MMNMLNNLKPGQGETLGLLPNSPFAWVLMGVGRQALLLLLFWLPPCPRALTRSSCSSVPCSHLSIVPCSHAWPWPRFPLPFPSPWCSLLSITPGIQLLSSFCHSHCPYWGCFPPALGPLLLLRSFLFVPLQKSNCCPYCLFSHIPMSWFLCLPSPKECLELPNSTATHLGHDPLPCKHVPSFPSLSRPGRLGLLPRKPTM